MTENNNFEQNNVSGIDQTQTMNSEQPSVSTSATTPEVNEGTAASEPTMAAKVPPPPGVPYTEQFTNFGQTAASQTEEPVNFTPGNTASTQEFSGFSSETSTDTKTGAEATKRPWYSKIGSSVGATLGACACGLLVVGLIAGLSASAGAQMASSIGQEHMKMERSVDEHSGHGSYGDSFGYDNDRRGGYDDFDSNGRGGEFGSDERSGRGGGYGNESDGYGDMYGYGNGSGGDCSGGDCYGNGQNGGMDRGTEGDTDRNTDGGPEGNAPSDKQDRGNGGEREKGQGRDATETTQTIA